jgi:hypothetical protein
METPLEWRELSFHLRMDRITKLYIKMCTDIKLFNGRRMDKSYFKIKSFLSSRPADEVAKLYDYLYTLEEPVMATLSEIYQIAEKHRNSKLFDKQMDKTKEMVKNRNIQKYADITISDIMSL